MKPLKTLLFTVTVFMLLAGTMLITPEEGVKVGEFTFHMPTFSEMFLINKTEYADVSEILEKQLDIDSLSDLDMGAMLANDSIVNNVVRASYDSLVQSIHKIEITDKGRQNLQRFFKKLNSEKLTRVMHYGDSQLEGDRITSLLRDKLQKKFGGSGPGLRPAVQPYDYVFSAVQENSENWKRYPIYGNVDSLVEHNRYGVMGAFSRFAPPVSDSIPFKDSVFYEENLSIAATTISFHLTREYERLRLFYGNTKRPVDFQVLINDSVLYSEKLKKNIDYGFVTIDLPDTTDAVSMKFSGWDSPDIYGIELASDSGVIVDNIALRGSSGLIFTKTDFAHSTKMYNDLNPALFILQFGGNVMPYIKDQKAVDSYGRWFTAQIHRLKQSCPDAAVLVIGPSDMSTKVKDKYVTYDYLPAVVEALRNAAISTGSGYWDMYQAMGGYNSMPGWVNAQPELARPDYTHFSTKGSRLIANMFYNALILEYNNYLLKSK
jgi:lysophospholipase L1-like esterase